MSWTLFGSTFLAIFIAELGDKTQIATFAIAGGSTSRWTVFAGSALALVATSAIAVLAGAWIGKYVPAIWLKRGAGITFLIMGVLFLLAKNEPPPAEPPTDAPAQPSAPTE
jgi:putative Ca2+/H+ antiporter (TMEM165/GDT1 family)